MYTVSIMTDYGFGHETCKPIAVGVTKAVANSIRRHFKKVLVWNDYTQTGQYVMMVDRRFCINHEDFEINTEEV